MILLDTSVLSLALRRRRSARHSEPAPVAELRRLAMEDADVRVPGVVLQELLSGLKSRDQFEPLRAALSGFPLVLATASDHLEAARIANECRWSGIAATSFDCLIAAQARLRKASLFTTDADFKTMQRVVPLQLHSAPG